ncbi:glycosyltransferase family 2 protein [Candidatus Methylospira mobilis]|uniref:Glycosyltransferase family 2 protein n=1 Tax=Candidatus Methylospira mobilis TaxID=1808979 RepID=A0A5Q0BK42_9GAMM|nr:glycosyltransferase family 2 protein [Candidatus Methylospira mobilis]QFY42528.1 glycosyltransferase family 2 protein [Candidatus Methylospira mobilis]WNV04365.1 glycosyltransferase family 2 protein [Candidatus Methylospira mobilis]
MISILILTKNEEHDLPGCLQSVSWSDDIHVFDSHSSDDTVAIAARAGAHVTQRDYDNHLPFGGHEGEHRTWGLRNIPFKYPWIFVIDADERMTPELAAEAGAAVANAGEQVAFSVQRRDYLFNTWLKHAVPTPFNIRLFKPDRVCYERFTNPAIKVDGEIGDLKAYFKHFPYSKGMSHWVSKHNNYSTLEARQIVENHKTAVRFSIVDAVFARNRNVRRFNQKELYYRLPCRPLVMFFGLYILKGGFLDGRAGLVFVLLRSIYEYFIVLKQRELEAG